MKKIIVVATLLLTYTFSGMTYAMSGSSKGGHPACLKEEWIDDMLTFAIANDKASFESYINSNKCLILKEGLKVSVTDSPGMFGNRVGFVYQGLKFWTTRDALNYGK